MSNAATLNPSVLAAAANSAMGSTGTGPAQASAAVQPASAPAALRQVMSTPVSAASAAPAANAGPAGPGIWQDIGALVAKLFDLIRRLIRFVVGIFFPPRPPQAEGKGADGQGKDEKDKQQNGGVQGEGTQAQALKQGLVDRADAAQAQAAQQAEQAQQAHTAPPDAASAVMAQHQKIADEHLGPLGPLGPLGSSAANDQKFKASDLGLLRSAFEEFALDVAQAVNEALRTGESPETQDQRMERAFEELRSSLVKKTEDELVALSNMREEAPDDLKHVMALIEEDRISEQELAQWTQQFSEVGDYLRIRQALQLHRMELESLEKVSREQDQTLRSFYARPSAVHLDADLGTQTAETAAVATASAGQPPVEQSPPAPVHQEERAPLRNIFARPPAPVESSANQASAVAPASSTSAAVETAPRQGSSAFAALALQSRLQEEAEGLADSGDEHEEPETAPVERPRG
jgi:hypothetical protein